MQIQCMGWTSVPSRPDRPFVAPSIMYFFDILLEHRAPNAHRSARSWFCAACSRRYRSPRFCSPTTEPAERPLAGSSPACKLLRPKSNPRTRSAVSCRPDPVWPTAPPADNNSPTPAIGRTLDPRSDRLRRRGDIFLRQIHYLPNRVHYEAGLDPAHIHDDDAGAVVRSLHFQIEALARIEHRDDFPAKVSDALDELGGLQHLRDLAQAVDLLYLSRSSPRSGAAMTWARRFKLSPM